MNVITINVGQGGCNAAPLLIGYAGEDSVDAVDFDFSAWAQDYGEGTISLELMRASDTAPYLAILTVDGTTARWTVSDVDTARSGPGVAQLIYKPARGTKKSAIYKFYVGRSLTEPGGDDPWGPIIERMEEILAEVKEQAEAADQSAEDASGSARDAEAWAVGERGGEPVPATDETHENNAKYYAEQAGETAREFSEVTAPAAVRAVNEAGQTQTQAITDAGAAAVQAVSAERAGALDAIGTARAGALDAIGTAGQTAASAVDTAKTGAVQAVNTAKTDALAAIEQKSTAEQAAVEQKGEDALAALQEYADLPGEVDDLKSAVTDLDSAVFERTTSVNRFDSSLVTSETITSNKRLWGDGTLRDAQGIDVTPFLPILPNTEYSMGLVPVYGGAGAPWYGTSICVEFYSDASETSQISRIDRTTDNPITFRSPANAKYYRFNIARSSGITLTLLANRFMVVYGPALPDTFSPYGDTEQSKIEILKTGFEDLAGIHYVIANNILTVTSNYSDGSIIVEFGKRGPNNLPDFRTITADGRNKFNNQTDWFGPFLMSAINNIDGDDITGRTYTGGNHNYMNTGSMDSTATGRNISLQYYANGKVLVGDAEGDTNRIEIAWVNRIQAYNTKKADGTGREVLEERHKMIYDGRQWEVFTEVEALEAIFCDSYYGMQCYVKDYGTIQMVGADYRLPFPYTTPHDSGNNTPNTYIAFDTNDRLEMEVDRSYDLGKGTMYGTSGTQGFRTASTKGYTYFISQKNMEANAIYGAHGWYRFTPNY